MNGNVVVALLLLGYLIAFCVYVFTDVTSLCEEQMKQDRLDLLWDDGDPRRDAEDAQTMWGAEAS